jgi:hypothetical protein
MVQFTVIRHRVVASLWGSAKVWVVGTTVSVRFRYQLDEDKGKLELKFAGSRSLLSSSS